MSRNYIRRKRFYERKPWVWIAEAIVAILFVPASVLCMFSLASIALTEAECRAVMDIMKAIF